MDTPSPWSTPESAPPHVSIIDFSPSCDALRELRTTVKSSTSPTLQGRAGSNSIQRTRLHCFVLLAWVVILTIALPWWLLDGEKQTILFQNIIKSPSGPPALDGLQFIDADHPYIRFVGRWSSTPDKTRKDGSFPGKKASPLLRYGLQWHTGVYFDFAFNGSNTILVSLHNTDSSARSPVSPSKTSQGLALMDTAHASHADPISLLARVDDDEYSILPNASSIVLIRKGNLDPHRRHDVRIIAPMFGGEVVETLQVEGIWIDEAGQLLPFETESATKLLTMDGTELVHLGSHHKMLEIVTDHAGSMAGRGRKENTRSRGSVLGGVIGWEYLLGEMFGVDHVTIGMERMCLIQECIGGKGSPAGLADVFFQRFSTPYANHERQLMIFCSGPVGSAQYPQPWLFEGYIPEVMVCRVYNPPAATHSASQVLNIGNADWNSFQMHNGEYNKTIWELSMVFEDTYVSLIRAIRTLAYPKYPTSTVNPAQIATAPPIFVMRPFRGQLEQATHSVVDRLRSEGDNSVFWLDTSGWLNTDVEFEGSTEDQDFFLDDGKLLPICHPQFTSDRGCRRQLIYGLAIDRTRQPTCRNFTPHACL